MSALGVGVIGLGAMGTDHVRTLTQDVPEAEVRVVHDADPARAEEGAAATGARPAADAEALVADAAVEAVVICSPDATHAGLTLACLGAGKPVLCEKPLGVGVAESERVVAAELDGGRRLVTVGFMRRFDPGYLELRELLAAGQVGEPLVVHNVHRNVAPHPAATSTGLVTNSMVHELDVLPWLLGRPVTGIQVRSPRSAGLRDPQVAVVELDDGRVLATVEVFLAARYGYDVRCEVVGTTGTAGLRAPGGVDVARDGVRGVPVAADFRGRFAQAYRRELTTWVRAARRGGAAGATAWDGHRANVVAAAGVESLRTGRTVAVADVPRPAMYR